MKTVLALAVGAVMLCALTLTVSADDKGAKGKEVTLKGDICCAKCCLKEADSCHTVIKVKKDNKATVYYFDKEGSKKYHKEICTEVKKGEVTGETSEKDGKHWVKVTKVKFE